MDNDAHFDSRYFIPNFTLGLQTLLSGRGNKKVDVLREYKTVPCAIYGINGKAQPITVK